MHNFKSSQPKVEEIGFTAIVGKKQTKTKHFNDDSFVLFRAVLTLSA